jgi:hypothetical protein
MRSMQMAIRIALSSTLALAAPAWCWQAEAGDPPRNDGGMVLRMCKGADKVKGLSVMCHSYLNGFLDGARHYGKDGKVGFCLEEGDREKLHAAVVDWITAHPEAQGQPAGVVLQKALAEKFPCKGKR